MNFSIKECIRFGWETFKKRPWFFVGATLLVFLAYIVLALISAGIDAAISGDVNESAGAGNLVNFFGSALINMGLTAFYLSAHDNVETAATGMLWHPRPFWTYLGAFVLVATNIVVGFLLLVVPGFIFFLMLIFTTFIVIDRELGMFESMGESERITRGHKWSLLGLVLVLMLINVLGGIAFVVGLLVSMPVFYLAMTHAYRVLAGEVPAKRADAVLA